jgi:hypothetical protein
VDRPTGGSPRSRVVGHFGWQPAARSSIAALRGLDLRGANLAIPRLSTEREPEVPGLRASGSQALVVAVQTGSLDHLNHLAKIRRLHRSGLRAVHLQGLVAAPAVVVGEVVLEDPSQMPLTETGVLSIQCVQPGEVRRERERPNREGARSDVIGS